MQDSEFGKEVAAIKSDIADSLASLQRFGDAPQASNDHYKSLLLKLQDAYNCANDLAACFPVAEEQ
jgi:hypothetical protein